MEASLALLLLMFGVFADDPDDPFSFDDLALLTSLLDARSYLHYIASYFALYIILPRVRS